MAALNRAETAVLRHAVAVLETIQHKPEWAVENPETIKKAKEELKVVLVMKGHYEK